MSKLSYVNKLIDPEIVASIDLHGTFLYGFTPQPKLRVRSDRNFFGSCKGQHHENAFLCLLDGSLTFDELEKLSAYIPATCYFTQLSLALTFRFDSPFDFVVHCLKCCFTNEKLLNFLHFSVTCYFDYEFW